MPNTFLDARDRWLDLSEIDYLGHFVRAWLALNAWYRSAYADPQDRVIVDSLKWQPNPIRSKLLPLLSAATAEGADLRSNIGLLHERLENYRIEVGKGADKKPISFGNVYLITRQVAPQTSNYQGWNYVVKTGAANGSVESAATDRNGNVRFSLIQNKYDLAGLENDPNFIANLNHNQQGRLRGLYVNFSPRLIADVSQRRVGGSQAFELGAVRFECPPEELFAAVVEVTYQMRCALFHGELIPTKDATACYEPAYRVVRQFLAAIT